MTKLLKVSWEQLRNCHLRANANTSRKESKTCTMKTYIHAKLFWSILLCSRIRNQTLPCKVFVNWWNRRRNFHALWKESPDVWSSLMWMIFSNQLINAGKPRRFPIKRVRKSRKSGDFSRTMRLLSNTFKIWWINVIWIGMYSNFLFQ